MEEKSLNQTVYKVYAKLDGNGNILNIDGGVTIKNVDVETWTLIDEGTNALKYGGCQQHYLDMPLMTPDGIPRYRWDGSAAVLRTEEEIEEDRKARPAPPPSTDERIATLEEQIAQADETAIDLYEAQEAQETINAQQDEALMEIYEMIG